MNLKFKLKDNMLPTNAQFNGVITAVIFILVVMISYNGIYRVRSGVILKLDKEKTELRQKLSMLKAINAEKVKAEKTIVQLEGYKDVSELMAQITQMTNQAGIVVNRIKPGVLRKEEHISIQPISIEMDCTYHSLGALIHLIESRAPYIRMERVSLGSSMNHSRDGVMPGEGDGPALSKAMITIVGIKAN